jgi:hypothetical protein
VLSVKLGFSSSTNFQAAFSANVLLARYPKEGFSSACSSVIGFQSASEYVWSQELPFEASIMDAKDEVMTTCLTVGAFFLIAFRMPVVPMMLRTKLAVELQVMTRELGELESCLGAEAKI